MSAASKWSPSDEATPETAATNTVDGYVVYVAGASLTVRVGDAERTARRATSCLIQPILGDRVLVAGLADGSSFVLAVLERSEPDAKLEIALDRDAVLSVADGRLDLVAEKGVGIASQEAIAMSSDKLEVRTREATIALDDLFVMGKKALTRFARATVVGEVLETVADTITQKAKRALRVVSEVDQVRAGFADYAAEKAMRLHGDNAFMTAEKVVKLDGENIHLG